jgi:hypothetical protein
MPLRVVLPSSAKLDRGLEELFHVERGDDLDPSARRAVAVVGEAVHATGGDDDRLARAGDDLAHAEAELHLALEDVEALFLLGVHVGAGDVAVGGELELDLELLAGGVAGRLQERDALAADGVMDDLSGVSHDRETRRRGVARHRPEERSPRIREDDLAPAGRTTGRRPQG